MAKHFQSKSTTILETPPHHAEAHYLRSLLFLKDGQTEAAQEALRAGLYAQRNDAPAPTRRLHSYTFAVWQAKGA
jgi:hypothetical protein